MIKELAEERREDEVGLRIRARLPVIVFRPSGLTVEEIGNSLEARISEARESVKEENINRLRADAEAAVEKIVGSGTHAERIKGKTLLRKLYNRLGLQGVSYEQFCYSVAQKAKDAPQVREIVKAVSRSLTRV